MIGSVGVHVAAHLVNALNFSVNYNDEFVELNAARYRNEVGGPSPHFPFTCHELTNEGL